jgi:hypothetical protein
MRRIVGVVLEVEIRGSWCIIYAYRCLIPRRVRQRTLWLCGEGTAAGWLVSNAELTFDMESTPLSFAV